MKLEDFANGNSKAEALMWIFNFLIATLAALPVLFSEYDSFTMAVFCGVFLLQRIHDILLTTK